MKISCLKEEILKGLQSVIPAISTKSSLPILGNILFETLDNGKIKLAATDLEISMTTTINAEILETGAITIPAKKLFDIAREVKGDNINISSTDTKITIKSGTSNFTIMGLVAEDFPVMPAFDNTDGSFNIDKELIKNMIRKTMFAVSYDETRYVLNGVLLEVEKNKMRMVSTDGRRLCFIENVLEQNIKESISVIIPTKAINELIKLLGLITDDAQVEVGVKDNQIAFKINDNVMISKLIEGNFPNYNQVIPSKHDSVIELPKDDFLSITKRVSLLSSEKMNSVKYSFSKGKLKVTTSNQGVGEAEDEMSVDYKGDNIEIAYNPIFIMDILRNIDDENVQLELTTALNPGIIRPKDNHGYLCVVMPMRVS